MSLTLATLLFLFPLHSTAIASSKAGTSCKKINATQRVGTVLYTCIMNGQKLVWDEGTFVGKTGSIPKKSPSPTPSSSPSSTSSSLLWSEEFNDQTPQHVNPQRWTHLLGNGYAQLGLANYGTGEIELNETDSAMTDGIGNLVISTTFAGGVWRSARIWTQGKVNFQYGKLEIHAKLPTGSFNWPAIWMLGKSYRAPNGLGESEPWPNSGEIDIMEGMQQNSIVQSTIHGNYQDSNSDWFGGAGITTSPAFSNISAEFHTFGMRWKPNLIIFTLDGVEYCRNSFDGTNILQTVNGATRAFRNLNVWPFNQPFFLIINNAITSGTKGWPEGTSSQFLIDWIHYSTFEGYGSTSTADR